MRKFMYSGLKSLPMAASIWAYLAGAAIAVPITVHVGDTLGVKFRFDRPFSGVPYQIAGAFVDVTGGETIYRGRNTTTLFNGNVALGTTSVGFANAVGGVFYASNGVPFPITGHTRVDFSSIRNRTMDGRLKTIITYNPAGPFVYDPDVTPFGPSLVDTISVSLNGLFRTSESAKVLSVTLNGRNIWNAIPAPQTAPPISSFPTPPTLFSNIGQFITSNISNFSQESQDFLRSQFTALGNAALGTPSNSVKVAATSVADKIDRYSNAYSLAKAFAQPDISNKLVSLTQWYGKKQVREIITDSSDAVTAGQLLFGYDFLKNTAQLSYSTPAFFLLDLNFSIYRNLLSPQLRILANDPFDPDYQSVILVNDPVFLNLPTTGSALLDEYYLSLLSSNAEAYLFLRAVNISFDRYTAAYAAGDPESTALQFEAILFYLDQFYSALGESGELLELVKNELINTGTADIEFDHDGAQALLDHYLYGLTTDEIDSLLGLGFTLEDIDLIKSELASVDLTQFQGSLFDGMSQLSEEFRVGAIGNQTASVPEPGTLLLLGAGLLALTRLRYASAWQAGMRRK